MQLIWPVLCRFSDAGKVVSTARGEAGVGEAPRHEVAGLGHDGAERYGVLRRAPVIAEWLLAQQMRVVSAFVVRWRRFSAVVVRA